MTSQIFLHWEISLFPRKSWKFSSNGNSVDSDLLLTIQFPGQRGSLNDFMQPLSIFLLGKKKANVFYIVGKFLKAMQQLKLINLQITEIVTNKSLLDHSGHQEQGIFLIYTR